MITKYGFEVTPEALNTTVARLVNQVFKLLPLREEKQDWQKPLGVVIEEIAGLGEILIEKQAILLSLLSQLEGLKCLQDSEDFSQYRAVVFSCIDLLEKVKV